MDNLCSLPNHFDCMGFHRSLDVFPLLQSHGGLASRYQAENSDFSWYLDLRIRKVDQALWPLDPLSR
jgi:hypothetical protein